MNRLFGYRRDWKLMSWICDCFSIQSLTLVSIHRFVVFFFLGWIRIAGIQRRGRRSRGRQRDVAAAKSRKSSAIWPTYCRCPPVWVSSSSIKPPSCDWPSPTWKPDPCCKSVRTTHRISRRNNSRRRKLTINIHDNNRWNDQRPSHPSWRYGTGWPERWPPWPTRWPRIGFVVSQSVAWCSLRIILRWWHHLHGW